MMEVEEKFWDRIFQGDALEVLKTLPDNSIDSCVTDPPCGIAFMGQKWDDDKGGRDQWIQWLALVMRDVFRVLKPGGHCLVWSLPRTSHWTGFALEDAGFEIRDSIYHLHGVDAKVSAFYATLSDEQRNLFTQILDSQNVPANILALFGSGFPKSLNVSSAIDKHLHAEREVIGLKTHPWKGLGNDVLGKDNRTENEDGYVQSVITAPATPEAQQYAGFGTALKPAAECWWLCRKPLAEKSVAANVLKFGTGGLNIDGSRIPASDHPGIHKSFSSNVHAGYNRPWRDNRPPEYKDIPVGRWPSHLLLSHTLLCTPEQCAAGCPVAELDEQSGIRAAGYRKNPSTKRNQHQNTTYGKYQDIYTVGERGYNDQGGASRYFATFRPDVPFVYSAKASRRERNEGCEALPERIGGCLEGNADLNNARKIGARPDLPVNPTQNNHPTVKAQQLMRYLVRLITPPGGVVLDCFLGSGSTAVACIHEGFHFVGIDENSEYVKIAQERIAYAQKNIGYISKVDDDDGREVEEVTHVNPAQQSTPKAEKPKIIQTSLFG